jgi:type II secretory pathway predicted ATPase ExeA/TPR repeat protein
MRAWLPSRRRDLPFAISSNPRAIFESISFRSTFLALTNAIALRAGLILLVGDAGCGKSVLLRAILDAHARENCPAFLGRATTMGDVLVALLRQLPVAAIPAGRENRLQALARCLSRQPGPAVLLVDEADQLSSAQLCELAALAAWRRGESDSLQVVLAGRPELEERLQRSELAEVARHVIAAARLAPLLHQEVAHYVAHHLALGRCADVSFTPAALDQLFIHTRGIPLKINLLCTCALAGKTARVDAAAIDAAAHFCGLAPPPSARPATATHIAQGFMPHPRRADGNRRSRRAARVAYRAAALAGIAGLGLGFIHLIESASDISRPDETAGHALALLSRTGGAGRVELAQKEYIGAAAAQSLAEAVVDRAPADTEHPPDPEQAMQAEPAQEAADTVDEDPASDDDTTAEADQLPTETADEVGPVEPWPAGPDLAADDDPGAEPQPADAQAPIAGAEPSPGEPVMTHLWPGGDDGAALSGSPEPSGTAAAEPPVQPVAQPAAPAPIDSPAPAAGPVAAQAPAPPSGAIDPASRAGAADTARLMARGYALLQEGDVASARLFFERAAAAGHAAALTALGQSFDPLELQRLGIIGIQADPGLALEWYRAASEAGDAAARERSARLSGWMERRPGRR